MLEPVVAHFLRARFFRRPPPKTAGREEFGREFVRQFLGRCGGAKPRDIVATATALTAHSIADALTRFVLRGETYHELIVSGGGARNPTLLAMLANELRSSG